jgi:hypothetical protein
LWFLANLWRCWTSRWVMPEHTQSKKLIVAENPRRFNSTAVNGRREN